MRRDWFKERQDREFQSVEDEIAAREIARENREAMLVRPLEFNDADLPPIASEQEPQERRY